MMKVICWNIERNKTLSWKELVQMGADVALLQEAGEPPWVSILRSNSGDQARWEPWEKEHYGQRIHVAAVARLSDRVELDWFKRVFPFKQPEFGELPVSGIGTIAAARVRERDSDREPFIAVSMSTEWLTPHPSTGSKWGVGYSDASAHRIVSDLSTFIGDEDPSTHRILAAGDLNVIYGATNDHPDALAARDRTVFERMEALGFEFLGPQCPNGRRAEPTPKGLPPTTGNVPTHYSRSHGGTPAKARNQLDYVFASKGFHESVTVHAMNGADKEEWGPSDHCRLWIEVE